MPTLQAEPETTREFFALDLPEALLHEARVMAIRRGGECSIEGALVEGLRLWVERERRRPRPEGNDDRFARSLHMLHCRLLAACFEQLEAVGESGPLPARDSDAWRDALGARRWLLADDRDNPLSYLNACDVLGLSIVRGREWARPYLARLESVRGPGARLAALAGAVMQSTREGL